MGTIIPGDSPECGWDARVIGADGKPRGLNGRELCRSVWAGAFDAFGADAAGAKPRACNLFNMSCLPSCSAALLDAAPLADPGTCSAELLARCSCSDSD